MPQPEEKRAARITGKMKRLTTGLAAGLGLAVLTVAGPLPPAFAQTQPSQDTRLKGLIEALNTELERGEQSRLIDPWFLRDLRRTINRYDNLWDTLLFEDKFSSQGTRPAPPWQVIAGEIVVDWRYGMRSVVQPVARTSQQPQAAPTNPLAQIFGAILSQATGQTQSQGPGLDPGTELRPAAAIAPVRITNAFSIRLELTFRPVAGVESPRFELGPYQGQGAAAGYRLVLLPGGTPSVELTSVSARDTASTLALHEQPLTLGDGQVHVVEWRRNENGRMVVRVDGTEVIDVVDRRFTGNFDGFSVANQGGDIALRSIRIGGTS